MASLIPLAGPAICAGSMGGMMWWMMRGKGSGSSTNAAEENQVSAQIAQLEEENAELRTRVDVLGPKTPSVVPGAEG
jgi:hypothetical protein